MTARRFVVGITGASGAVYARRLLEVLLATDCEVQACVSPSGVTVIKQELGVEIDPLNLGALMRSGSPKRGTLRCFHYGDFMAPMASGSAPSDGMVVCPCSGGTLSAIAHAASDNLIHRAAEVHLKERRKLILVPRETPLSLPHIENLRLCTIAGAVVLPASPGFYHGARTIDDLVDFIVGRICDQLGVEQKLVKQWGANHG
jgi:4-hydroxy-3-polyprenylbenzoate decarboxylase